MDVGAKISNPKRAKKSAARKEGWFDYYAGFSARFVADAIREIRLPASSSILDPWNGSGTTTSIAHELGFRSVGIDINPVMVVVARAKLLTRGVTESLLPLADDLLAKATFESACEQDDPLLTWFTPRSASSFRSLANAIAAVLTPLKSSSMLYTSDGIAATSDLASFFLVALFRTVRSFLQPFQATNPTWIKNPATPHCRLRPGSDQIRSTFKNMVEIMADAVTSQESVAKSEVLLGSSASLTTELGRFDAVISSPPYCTRIDYAVATKPELALLGCPLGSEFRTLRQKLIGSPVIAETQPDEHSDWGDTCLSLLNAVRHHPSKGSSNYYFKVLAQYFHDMHSSMTSLRRVLKVGGECVLVVQDSHYKSEHIDMAQIIIDMASSINWSLLHRFDFATSFLMARMNPRCHKYRSHQSAVESVLWFKAA